jgi:glycerate dehydrogenase
MLDVCLRAMPRRPKAVFLDYATVGPDVDVASLERVVDLECHAATSPENVPELIRGCEVVIVNKTRVSRRALLQAPEVKLIALVATGTDNVDIGAARDAGVAVTNIRDYCNTAVVQHVFALVLSLTQGIHHYAALVRDGAWQRSKTFALFDYPIRELTGLNLGIVGHGSLGRAVGEFGRCLGMHVLVSARPDAAPDAVPAGRVAFDEVVRAADVLTLHCPLTDATRHMLNRERFGTMKRGAIVINTARGGLIDSADLVTALTQGLIGGAGIDVLAEEPPTGDDPLLSADLPNLIVTPHIAWAAREARQRAINQVTENIAAFLSGESLRRVV